MQHTEDSGGKLCPTTLSLLYFLQEWSISKAEDTNLDLFRKFQKYEVDDPVGAFTVHAVGGLWGMLAVGLFLQDDTSLLG